jgi:hypothetical protein
MGKMITEKILAKAVGRGEVSPGNYIEVGSRCPTPMGKRRQLAQRRGILRRMESRRFRSQAHQNHRRHLGATASHNAAASRMRTRKWGKRWASPTRIFIHSVDPASKACFSPEELGHCRGSLFTSGQRPFERQWRIRRVRHDAFLWPRGIFHDRQNLNESSPEQCYCRL